MIANTDAALRAINEDHSLVKCVAIARRINKYELLDQRLRDKIMWEAKHSLVQSVTTALVKNGFVQLVEEPTPEGIVLNCFSYVIDPKVIPLKDDQKILTL